MGLTGWGWDCIYRQHGGTTSKMPPCWDSCKTFKFYWQKGFQESFFQLQIRNSGREIIPMIPFKIWKMLTGLSPTSYLHTYYKCWDVSLIVGALSFVSWKPGKDGEWRGVGAVGDEALHHLSLWSCHPKAGQDTGKEWLSKEWLYQPWGMWSMES